MSSKTMYKLYKLHVDLAEFFFCPPQASFNPLSSDLFSVDIHIDPKKFRRTKIRQKYLSDIKN